MDKWTDFPLEPVKFSIRKKHIDDIRSRLINEIARRNTNFSPIIPIFPAEAYSHSGLVIAPNFDILQNGTFSSSTEAGINFSNSPLGSYFKLDTVVFPGTDLNMVGALFCVRNDNIVEFFEIEYSDDNVNWNRINTLCMKKFTGYGSVDGDLSIGLYKYTTSWIKTTATAGDGQQFEPNAHNTSTAVHQLYWTSVGSHRYWRVTRPRTNESTLANSEPFTEFRWIVDINSVIKTDVPIVALSTKISKRHLDELRALIKLIGSNSLKTFTDPTIVAGETKVRAIHFQELRNKIDFLESCNNTPNNVVTGCNYMCTGFCTSCTSCTSCTDACTSCTGCTSYSGDCGGGDGDGGGS